MGHFWTTMLILLVVWLILGLIALGLAYILVKEEDDKISFWSNFGIIGLGFISLVGVIDDINDKFPVI